MDHPVRQFWKIILASVDFISWSCNVPPVRRGEEEEVEEGRRSGIEGNDPRGRRHLGALEQPRRGVVAVAADHQSRPTTKAPSVSGYVNITSKVSRLGFGPWLRFSIVFEKCVSRVRQKFHFLVAVLPQGRACATVESNFCRTLYTTPFRSPVSVATGNYPHIINYPHH